MLKLSRWFCWLLLPTWAAAASPTLPGNEAVPGGVAVVALPVDGGHAPSVKLGERRIMVIRHEDHWYAVVGISLDTAPGDLSLDVAVPDTAVQQVEFSVAPKQYPEQDLTIRN